MYKNVNTEYIQSLKKRKKRSRGEPTSRDGAASLGLCKQKKPQNVP